MCSTQQLSYARACLYKLAGARMLFEGNVVVAAMKSSHNIVQLAEVLSIKRGGIKAVLERS